MILFVLVWGCFLAAAEGFDGYLGRGRARDAHATRARRTRDAHATRTRLDRRLR